MYYLERNYLDIGLRSAVGQSKYVVRNVVSSSLVNLFGCYFIIISVLQCVQGYRYIILAVTFQFRLSKCMFDVSL